VSIRGEMGVRDVFLVRTWRVVNLALYRIDLQIKDCLVGQTIALSNLVTDYPVRKPVTAKSTKVTK
jgi:hypothetical protein